MSDLDTLRRMEQMLISVIRSLMPTDKSNQKTFGVAVLIDGNGDRLGFASGLYRHRKTPHAEDQITRKLEKWIPRLRAPQSARVLMLVEIDACGPESANCRRMLQDWANRTGVKVDFYQLVTKSGREGKSQIRTALAKGQDVQTFKALKDRTYIPQGGQGVKGPGASGKAPQQAPPTPAAKPKGPPPIRPSPKAPAKPSSPPQAAPPKAAAPSAQRALDKPAVNKPSAGRSTTSPQQGTLRRGLGAVLKSAPQLLRGALRILNIVSAVSEPLRMMDYLSKTQSKLAGEPFILKGAAQEAERIRKAANTLHTDYAAFSQSLLHLRFEAAGQIADASGKKDFSRLSQAAVEIHNVMSRLEQTKNSVTLKIRSIDRAEAGVAQRMMAIDRMVKDPAIRTTLIAARTFEPLLMVLIDLDPIGGALSNASDILKEVRKLIDADMAALGALLRTNLELAGELM